MPPQLRLSLIAFAAALLPAAPVAARQLEAPQVQTPAIAAHAASAEGFAPTGWRVEYKANGDLNRDGKADIVLVLRDQDPRNVLKNTGGLGVDPFDTNPRLLVIAFAAPDGGYDLAAIDDRLIARPDDPAQDDVLEDASAISVRRGAVHVRLYLFMSAGGWTAGSCTFAFRWEQGRFRLIGYDAAWIARNTSADDEISVNYLTGRLIDRKRGGEGHLNNNPPIWLGDIDDGLRFDPLENI